MLIENAVGALAIVFDPLRLMFLCFGVVLGLIIGVIPGIGGLAGMALLIPFAIQMPDAYTAIAFLIGMWAVTATADTVPAILFGVPGAVGSAATVLDGYPMAQRGEAGRAFGASFFASVLGGLFGAILLALSIPLLQPFLLAIGTPELLAVCILGLTLVASVSQGAVLKGLIMAAFGVLLAAIGDEAQTGTVRWTFDLIYLWDGIQIEALALGLFAVPELIDMAIAQKNLGTAQRIKGVVREQWRGVRDVIENWRLVIHSSSVGVFLGSVPGMGAAVVDWLAYGAAARFVKGGAQSFGTGDVRGVIASEAANNSREGGALIPTLAFGVPGSPSMALLLGAFLAFGIPPGPSLLSTKLDITFTLIWSLALANVIGAGICFLSANQLARLATIRWGILVPTVLAICFVGAYQGSRSYGDIVTLLVFGFIGWIMKQHGWARAPLILGFILGKLIEKYLFISVGRYQLEWLQRPGVVAILAIAALVLARPLIGYLIQLYRAPRAREALPAAAPQAASAAAIPPPAPIERIVGPSLWIAAGIGFAVCFVSATDWRFAARLMPQSAAVTGLIVILCSVAGMLLAKIRNEPMLMTRAIYEVAGTFGGLPEKEIYKRLGVQALWLFGFLAAVLLIGMMPAMGLYMVLYMIFYGETRWSTALLIVVPMWIGMYVLFVTLLNVPWPPSLLGDLLPELRTLTKRLI